MLQSLYMQILLIGLPVSWAAEGSVKSFSQIGLQSLA